MSSRILYSFFALSVLFCCQTAVAETPFEKYQREADEKFDQYREQKRKEFESYRKRVNEEFAKYLEERWVEAEVKPAQNAPEIPSPAPVIIDEDDSKVVPALPEELVINDIIDLTNPQPQPQPFEPIEDIVEENVSPEMTVRLYGTDFSLRKPDLSGFGTSFGTREEIARGWKWLSDDRTNNLINDCLRLREDSKLCDWVYLNLLQKVSEELTGGNGNATTLLTGYLFSQSGYKMRFATDERGRLHIFYNPTGIVFNIGSLYVDGDRFYRFDSGIPAGDSFEICNFSFPNEQSLSFDIRNRMDFDLEPSPSRAVTAHFHPEVNVEVSVNKNLIDFYGTYPVASITDNPYSIWAIHGNTPASQEIERDLYPALREAVRGKSQSEAVNILLHLAQSFEYGYDDQLWGGDRIFFMDESWYYPYSDCEDHAINFSRLVRDICGLDVALVYYPGHLAAAVAFTDPDVTGDYIMYDGRKYIVCDPTYFYSNVGMTMSGMNNAEAELILLRR
ncbi:MAG: hypothetical protein K2M03_01100 [Muribaculaceae bacterium]|nr:hypothetical protein [Muribaculaceae bacterium]